MDELLNDFIVETTESLQQVDVDLVGLEADPSDASRVDGIFRLVHTIKGTSGFMNLKRLERVAHAGENVLGLMRDRTITVESDGVSVILMAVDRVRELVEAVGATGAEPAGSDDDVLSALDVYMRAALAGGPAAPAPEAEPEVAPEPEASGAQLDEMSALAGEVSLEELDRLFAETEVDDNSDAAFEAIAAMDLPKDLPEAAEAAAPAPAPEAPMVAAPEAGGADAPKPAGTSGAPKPEPTPESKPKAPDAPALTKAPEGASGPSQSIRVSVDLLEDLMTMVSELVLTRNQLLQLVRGQSENAFSLPLQRLNQITTDLQEGVMKARMQPIGNAWSKLPRIVRDLSRELGKDIKLDMLGQETELDRQVLELIKDPLTHMVRNSGDHGIEMPDAREAAGKPRQGTIRLDARHEGGQIVIELIDDGKGLDLSRIRDKAVAKGLVSEEDAELLSEKQVGRFIFHPGFSTADAVTAVSGRGVGMDVVKTNIEKIGGTVDLVTEVGRGTTFTIKIPLTLAIVSSLIVEASGERFAIPQMSVLELVRTSATSEHQIERIEETPVLRLRDRLLPLVRLSDALKIGGGQAESEAPVESYVVVTQVASYRFGIIVDGVFDTEEIVVKPVAPVLRSIPMFSGNTILGDGSVVMILDPNGLARHTSELTTSTEIAAQESAQDTDAETRSMLIFYAGDKEPKALPLSLIARLEEFEPDQIETVNGQAVVNYRDALIPVLSFDHASLKRDEPQPAVVFMEQGNAIGLAIDKIVDIVEETFTVGLKSHNAGCLGTAILRGKATNIVDLSYFVEKAGAIWNSDFGKAAAYSRPKRALIVEDSPFFRNVLRPILEAEGYNVIMAVDPTEAINTLEDGVEFDIIVSDIEMPNMNGFEFAQYLERSRWADVPVIAVTSRYNEDDRQRGIEAGFDGFMRKLDQPALVEELRRHAVEAARRRAAA